MLLLKKLLGIALGLFLITMGAQKLIGDVPIFKLIEIYTGLGFAEPIGRYVTAILELISGLLLILGKRWEGGLLAMAILVGAVLMHLSVLGIYTPISTAEDAPKSPMLFITAVIGFLIASYVTVKEFTDSNPNLFKLPD